MADSRAQYLGGLQRRRYFSSPRAIRSSLSTAALRANAAPSTHALRLLPSGTLGQHMHSTQSMSPQGNRQPRIAPMQLICMSELCRCWSIMLTNSGTSLYSPRFKVLEMSEDLSASLLDASARSEPQPSPLTRTQHTIRQGEAAGAPVTRHTRALCTCTQCAGRALRLRREEEEALLEGCLAAPSRPLPVRSWRARLQDRMSLS